MLIETALVAAAVGWQTKTSTPRAYDDDAHRRIPSSLRALPRRPDPASGVLQKSLSCPKPSVTGTHALSPPVCNRHFRTITPIRAASIGTPTASGMIHNPKHDDKPTTATGRSGKFPPNNSGPKASRIPLILYSRPEVVDAQPSPITHGKSSFCVSTTWPIPNVDRTLGSHEVGLGGHQLLLFFAGLAALDGRLGLEGRCCISGSLRASTLR